MSIVLLIRRWGGYSSAIIQSQKVPAKKAKKGVPNPFKPGELMDVAAKPASTKVKVRPLKKLKDMAM